MSNSFLIALLIVLLIGVVIAIVLLIRAVKGLKEDYREIVRIEDRLSNDDINWEEGV